MAIIAMGSPYYPPSIGGIEIHTKNLVTKLRRKGHEVVVVSSIGSDLVPRCLKIPYSPIPISFPKVKAEIYHSHVPSPFFARRFAELSEKERKPHVVTYHNDVILPSRVNGYPIPRFIARLVEKLNDHLVIGALEKAEVIIATTKSYAETSPVLSKFMNKIKIVPNAVDPSEFCPGVDAGKREPLVLYVGRLVAYKGVSTLIKAMAEVQKEMDAKLVVVGDGEDRKAFERLAEKLSVKAVFTGRVPRKEVVEWMQKARVLVLPSYSRLEAFGIALLEAMACSTPVIGANTPGVSEVALQGGFTFNSLQELVEKIKEVLQDDLLATKLGKNGRKAVEEKFNWDFVVERIEKIYFEVLG
ncbi:MAG: glycosyltransferase family 4 protein [Archaeoglobaceae archaeon]|nr:glycosyltransferase family 4 protein [Archaeoglobaceae archaeon]MDW8128824.1 glycosyltransferase family 4 protein [Archaeoglobaceae archaeon]